MNPEKRRVLVVDDDTDYLAVMAMALGQEFNVILASDGMYGLELTRQARPDAVILDLMMPDVSGVEFIRNLRADALTREVPVIIVTAKRCDERMREFFETDCRASGLLEKGIGLDALRQEIESALPA